MPKIKYYANIALAISSLIIGVCIGYAHLTEENSGFPIKSELTEKSGHVHKVQKYKYGVRFSFLNDKMNFEYPSKSEGQSVVYQALIESKGQRVTILFDSRKTHSPIYSEKVYNNFYELKIGEKLVRSYNESEQAWKSDDKLTPIIVAMFLLGGAYIFWNLYFHNRKST